MRLVTCLRKVPAYICNITTDTCNIPAYTYSIAVLRDDPDATAPVLTLEERACLARRINNSRRKTALEV